jgi:hypothetical protein
LSFGLCNAHVSTYSSAYCGIVVGGRLFISIIVYILLFGYASVTMYPALAVEVVEAFVELPSINQEGGILYGVV